MDLRLKPFFLLLCTILTLACLATFSCTPLVGQQKNLQLQRISTANQNVTGIGLTKRQNETTPIASKAPKPPQPIRKTNQQSRQNCSSTSHNLSGSKHLGLNKSDHLGRVDKVDCPVISVRHLDDSDTSVNEQDRRAISRQGKMAKKVKVDFSSLFREESNNYPEEEIKILLDQTPIELKNLFNVLNTVLDPNANLTERIAHHYTDEDSYDQGSREESICRSTTRNIYPRQANKDNSLVYIPNNQEFMQVIQAEICQNPDQECSYLQDNLPYGMLSVCHQKYAFKKLLYLDPLEKRMASDLFRYPSCCSCHIKILNTDLRSSINHALNSSKLFTDSSRETSKPIALSSKEAPVDASLANQNYQMDNKKPEVTSYVNPKDSDTHIIDNGVVRNAKALTSSRETTTSPGHSNGKRKTTANIEDSELKGSELLLPNDYNGSQNQPSNSQGKRSKGLNATQTIVLQEDGVYTPTQ